MNACVKDALSKAVKFVVQAFCDNGQPSSSRLIGAWLSMSSMALIWFIVRHAMSQPVDKLGVWLSNLPLIIGALATFAVSPYGVNKITGMFKRHDGDDKPEGEDK